MKFKGVQEDDVLKALYDGPKLIGFAIGDKKLSDTQIQALRSEAELLMHGELWKLLCDRTYFSAQIKGIDNAKDFGDLREARGAIDALAMFNSLLHTLIGFKVEKKP